jgi:hypothetical protein
LIMCSAIGRFRIGTIGFGKSHVKGLSLVPDPPAISTARIKSSSLKNFSTVIVR